jgi:hypothetical protein
MKNVISTLMLLLLLIPTAVMAMDHGKSMDHDKMNMSGMDHSKMDMNMDMKMDMSGMEGMIMLNAEKVDGVKAMFHLLDVKSAMAKAGQPFTHHLMVNFVDSKTGKAIEEGRVAVKVTTPAGVEEKAKMMMGMEGGFGVDLVIDQAGLYHFHIASKLEDGKKRKFHPHHEF